MTVLPECPLCADGHHCTPVEDTTSCSCCGFDFSTLPELTILDNEPAPKPEAWGYLPCGCRDDGYGRHVR